MSGAWRDHVDLTYTPGTPRKTGASRPSVLTDKRDLALGFFRRPPIRLVAGAAHQHRSLGVAEAVSLQKGLDALLVVDDRKRARPVRAPQAALEPPAVEYAGQRVPDVRERIRVLRQRAGAGDLDHRILALSEFHNFRKIGPGLRRRWRYARLLDAHMVDDEPRVGVAVGQHRVRVDVAPEQDVDREIVFDGRAQDAVEPRIVRRAL